jgi:hypothetical protein
VLQDGDFILQNGLTYFGFLLDAKRMGLRGNSQNSRYKHCFYRLSYNQSWDMGSLKSERNVNTKFVATVRERILQESLRHVNKILRVYPLTAAKKNDCNIF